MMVFRVAVTGGRAPHLAASGPVPAPLLPGPQPRHAYGRPPGVPAVGATEAQAGHGAVDARGVVSTAVTP